MHSPQARGLSLEHSEDNFDYQTKVAFEELYNLKIYQKFALPESPWLVDNFPLFINPVTTEMKQLLAALNKLSSDDILPKDRNYVLYPQLRQIMLHSLSLAHELADSDVTNRKEKIVALTAVINKIIPFVATPKSYRNPHVAKSAGEVFLVTMNMSWYFFSRNTPVNHHAFKLYAALEELTYKAILSRDYSNHPIIVTLTSPEQDILDKKKERFIQDYARYEHACNVLQRKATQTDSQPLMIRNLSHADFEFIKTRVDRKSFDELIHQLQRMEGYAEDLKKEKSFAYAQFHEMVQFSIDLTFEIIHSRKLVGRKFDALAKTLEALTDYAEDFNSSSRREKLNSATTNLRNLTEGSLLNRKEHRLRNGIIGCITLIKSLMFAVTGILFIVALPSATILNPAVGLLAAAGFIAISVGATKGFTWLYNSISPPEPAQQTISLKISKQIDSLNKFYQSNPATNTFQPLSGADAEEKSSSMLQLPLNSYNKEEFNSLSGQLMQLKDLPLSPESPFFVPVQALLHNAILLTNEIAQADYDKARSSQQKEKIIALTDTITQTKVFIQNSSATAKDQLIKTTHKMRNIFEGGYFNREENRMMAGFFSAVMSIAAIGMLLIPIILLTPVIPVITPALVFEIAACFTVGLATLAMSSRALKQSIYPHHPEQQAYSRGIYQQVNSLQPTLFKNKPQEEKKDNSPEPSILHNSSLRSV
jgi:hypothetical protein